MSISVSHVSSSSRCSTASADFYRTLAQIQEQFSSRCVAAHLPIGEERDPHAVASPLKLAITRGELSPVACGVATKNLGPTHCST